MFYGNNHRLPKVRDQGMMKIRNIIRKGEWRAFGVNTWNDLLKLTFGLVNQRKNIYIGEKGFQRAILELKSLETRNGKMPTTYDKGIGGIVRAVKRGTWKDMDICTWNDLLTKVFGKVNIERKKYDGKKGLELAKKELQLFHSKKGRLPKYKDKEVKGTIGAIQMKKWIVFGICHWKKHWMKIFLICLSK